MVEEFLKVRKFEVYNVFYFVEDTREMLGNLSSLLKPCSWLN